MIVLHDVLIPDIDKKNFLDTEKAQKLSEMAVNYQIWRKKNCCGQTDEK